LEIHVPIQPQIVFFLGGLPITNTLLTSWVAAIALIVFGLVATRALRGGSPAALSAPRGVQNAAEAIVELLLALGEQAVGAHARRFLPLVATLFLYIWFANWIGILPGVGTIPVLRTANSDLSITAAMAILVFLWVQITGLRANPKAYLLKFLWPPFLGQLEIISEIARPVALALRLFGNILAGFLLVEVMLQIAPYGVPAVFLAVELGVGLIQALIFAILTLAFLSLAAAHGHEEAHH
jgi:F-type H+-transporting ATPase subunit a